MVDCKSCGEKINPKGIRIAYRNNRKLIAVFCKGSCAVKYFTSKHNPEEKE